MLYVFRDVWYVVAGVPAGAPKGDSPLWHAWVGAFVCPVLFSGMVELLQEYCTTYRGGDWLDFAANTTGALIASLIGYFVLRPRMAKKQ